MKIAIIANNGKPLPTPPTYAWAPGIVMANEARVLKDLGMDVRVYCAKGSEVEGEIVHFDMDPSDDVFKDLEPPQQRIRGNYYNNNYQCRITQHLKQNPVDIIHLHNYQDFPMFRAANLNIPIVVTMHNDFYYGLQSMPDSIKGDLNTMKTIAIGSTPKIPEGINPPVAVIPNILNLTGFEFIEKPQNRVVYVGRMIKEKGPDIAIEATRLAGENIGMYGETFGESNWESMMRELFDSPHVTYNGFLPHTEVHNAYDAKVFIMPIRKPEGFPSVILESQSCGTPVITFDFESTASLIKEGVTGFVVPQGDVNAMAEAIKKVNTLDRKKCREEVLSRFDEKKIGFQLIEVFKKLISEFQQT
jgi:glycosyltransferase involved in cell wall biosynthesis